jgi:hypothetical protein
MGYGPPVLPHSPEYVEVQGLAPRWSKRCCAWSLSSCKLPPLRESEAEDKE